MPVPFHTLLHTHILFVSLSMRSYMWRRSSTRCSQTWQRLSQAKVRLSLFYLAFSVPLICVFGIGEMLDRIEYSVEKSHNYVKHAADEVTLARAYQSKARHVRPRYTLPLLSFMCSPVATENDLLLCVPPHPHCNHCGDHPGTVKAVGFLPSCPPSASSLPLTLSYCSPRVLTLCAKDQRQQQQQQQLELTSLAHDDVMSKLLIAQLFFCFELSPQFSQTGQLHVNIRNDATS